MIYTVTFNPSLDYIVDVKYFKKGTVNRTSAEKIFPGGKGINVSIVLNNLGLKNTALGFEAGFTGKEIIRLLSEVGIETDFINVSGGLSRINIKMRSDSETEINGIGPIITNDDIDKLYRKLDKITDGDILVLAGSIPSSITSTIYMDIMNYLQHKKIYIVVDATKDLLTKVLKLKPFLIKPNNFELGEIFGVEIHDKNEVLHYAKELQKKGARNVLVSMAEKGAVFVSENGDEFLADAPKGKLVNSVGAGDSMVAGFLYGYSLNNDYANAFKYSVCTGSASAFSEQLATKNDVEDLVNEWENLL